MTPPPLTNEKIDSLSRHELIAYAEKNEECYLVHCIYDILVPDSSPEFGVVTRIKIPGKVWWEFREKGTLKWWAFAPLPSGQLNEKAAKTSNPETILTQKSRGGKNTCFFTRMSKDRVRLETSSDDYLHSFLIYALGTVRASGKELRTFLRSWENEKYVTERKRLDYSNHFPKLGYLAKDPEIEVIHSEACKLKEARERYETNLEKLPSDGENCEELGKLKDPDNEIYREERNLLLEQIIGRRIVQKMSLKDYQYFDLLSEITKNLKTDQAWIEKPKVATDRKRQILFMASKLIERTNKLPLKSDLFDAINSDFSKVELYDERQFRKDLKALGLGGLPTTH